MARTKVDNCLVKLQSRYPTVPKEMVVKILDDLDRQLASPDFVANAKAIRLELIAQTQAGITFKAKKALAAKRLKEFLDTPGLNLEKDVNNAFKAITGGLESIVEGGNLNYNVMRQTLSGRFFNVLDRALGEDLKILADGKLDLEIATGVEMLNKGQPLTGLNPKIAKAAKAIHTYNNTVINTLQSLGSTIPKREDYIARQTHNWQKLKAAGYDQWASTIKPLIDVKATVGDQADLDEYLKGVFDSIISGEYETGIGTVGGKRSIIFKGAASYIEYNQLFGHGTLMDTLVASAYSAGRNGALTRLLGPDPRAGWDQLEKAVYKKLESPEAKADFNSILSKQSRNAMKAEVIGYDRSPGGSVLAKTTDGLLKLQAMSKLGTAIFSTFPDTALSVAGARANLGQGAGFAEWNVVKNFLAVTASKEEQKFWAAAADLTFSDALGATFDRYGSLEAPGRSGQIMNTLTKFGSPLLNDQTRWATTSMVRMYSMNLTKQSGMPFAGLDPRFKASLSRYGLGEAEWNLFKHAETKFSPDIGGVTAEGIRNIPDSLFKGTKLSKEELSLRVANYLTDSATSSLTIAGPLERATLLQGQSPDSFLGAGLRLVSQFKTAPLSIGRIIKRVSKSNPNVDSSQLSQVIRDKGSMGILAAMMVEGTILAGLGYAAKQAVKGKEPQMDSNFWTTAVSMGAMPLAAGYVFDSLRGEYDSFGRSIFKDMAGPTLGQIDDLEKLISGAARFESETGSRALKLFERNAPLLGNPLVRPLLNKAFLTEWHEYLNPGYEARLLERELREGTNRIFNTN